MKHHFDIVRWNYAGTECDVLCGGCGWVSGLHSTLSRSMRELNEHIAQMEETEPLTFKQKRAWCYEQDRTRS